MQVAVPADAKAAAGTKQKVLTYSFASLKEMVASDERAEYLVQSLIRTDSVSLIVGDSGIGKSPFLYEMGIAVAAGKDFLHFKTNRTKVVYVDMENGLRQVERIAQRVSKHLGLESVPENFQFAVGDSICNDFDLGKMLMKEKRGLVIIDTLRSFKTEAECKSTSSATFLKQLRGLARTHGCAFVVVHHLKKPSKEFPGPALEDCPVLEWLNEASGSRALVNQTDTRIALARPKRTNAGTGEDSYEVALVMKSNTRVEGDYGPLFVARDFDPDGEPIGYRLLTGAELLPNDDYRKTFAALPAEFRFTDAKRVLGKSDSSTDNFLHRCIELRLIVKEAGRYRKCQTGKDTVETRPPGDRFNLAAEAA
jgi:hypothetical protein